MSRRTFEESVRRALDSLPPAITARLRNVAVVVEDEDPEDPDLFGLFREEPYQPATIAIYRAVHAQIRGDVPATVRHAQEALNPRTAEAVIGHAAA